MSPTSPVLVRIHLIVCRESSPSPGTVELLVQPEPPDRWIFPYADIQHNDPGPSSALRRALPQFYTNDHLRQSLSSIDTVFTVTDTCTIIPFYYVVPIAPSSPYPPSHRWVTYNTMLEDQSFRSITGVLGQSSRIITAAIDYASDIFAMWRRRGY